MRIRLLGLALLIVSAAAFYRLYEVATPPSLAGSGLDQLALSLVAVVTLLAGASLLIAGPSLFEPIDDPTHGSQRTQTFNDTRDWGE